jgi:hypothetical protein
VTDQEKQQRGVRSVFLIRKPRTQQELDFAAVEEKKSGGIG